MYNQPHPSAPADSQPPPIGFIVRQPAENPYLQPGGNGVHYPHPTVPSPGYPQPGAALFPPPQQQHGLTGHPTPVGSSAFPPPGQPISQQLSSACCRFFKFVLIGIILVAAIYVFFGVVSLILEIHSHRNGRHNF